MAYIYPRQLPLALKYRLHRWATWPKVPDRAHCSAMEQAAYPGTTTHIRSKYPSHLGPQRTPILGLQAAHLALPLPYGRPRLHWKVPYLLALVAAKQVEAPALDATLPLPLPPPPLPLPAAPPFFALDLLGRGFCRESTAVGDDATSRPTTG